MNKLIDRFNAFPLHQRVLLLVLAMILLGAGFLFFVYADVQDQIDGKRSRLTTLERELQEQDLLRRNKAEVLAELEKLKRQMRFAREQLPSTAEVPTLLQLIHNNAKTAGLEINKFKRVPDSTKDYYIEIPVEMELAGTYDELANFFYYVSTMNRIVNVSNITLSRDAKGLEPDGGLRVTALATTFMYKSSPEPAPTAPPQRK